jgi:hypothetical protein
MSRVILLAVAGYSMHTSLLMVWQLPLGLEEFKQVVVQGVKDRVAGNGGIACGWRARGV